MDSNYLGTMNTCEHPSHIYSVIGGTSSSFVRYKTSHCSSLRVNKLVHIFLELDLELDNIILKLRSNPPHFANNNAECRASLNYTGVVR